MEFSVCFTGELRSDFKKESVKKNFSELFNLNDENVLKHIFSASSPLLIRKNLTLLKAERYREELYNIGMQAIIIDEENKSLQKVIPVKAIETTPNTDTFTASDNERQEANNYDYVPLFINTCTTTAAFSWLSTAVEQFKKAPKFWVSTMFIWGVIFAILQIIPFVGSLMATTFSGMICTFLTLVAHRLSNDKEISFSTVMNDLNPRIVQIVILNAFFGIFFTTFFLITLTIFGDNLLISIVILMAGTVAISMAFLFAPILILVKHASIPDALQLSFTGCRKNILPLSIYSLLATGIMAIGMIPLGLGILITIPLLALATYQACDEIFVSE